MKAEELMIGDWVNVFDVPKQIEGIRTFKNGDEIVYYDGNNGNFIKSVTPILLTEEILEKNGFKTWTWWKHHKDDTVTYAIGEGLHVEIEEQMINGKNEKIFNLVDNCNDSGDYGYESNYICDVNYVHELQHALKLCKIEKEIIL